MKIGCRCGETIIDQTDDLPFKGHWTPDQEYYVNLDAFDDEVIDPVAEGQMGKQAAYRQGRLLLSRSARLMWQCSACGRLYIEGQGRDERLWCFAPEGEPVNREVLRSRPSSTNLTSEADPA